MKRLILATIIIFACSVAGAATNKVCFKDSCFCVELARTHSARTRGLKFRERLGDREGMLFIFEAEDFYGFWMKDTLIPLDIVWIGENKKVVFIKKNARPCKTEKCRVIYSEQPAKYVLELNAGSVDKIGLELGDTLTFCID